MRPCIFIFGFGYTAQLLAPKLVAQGFKVIGTTSRTLDKFGSTDLNIELIDFDCPTIEDYIKLATYILVCIPPIERLNDITLAKYSNLIIQNASHLTWLGYLSSTSVYGNYNGNWVDEQSACIPHTATGIARLKAEQSWIAFAQKYLLPLHIFRLSGIYGPARNVLHRLMLGKKYSIYKENQVFCRIHVEDIVATLLASLQKPNPLSIYNLSDDEPAPAHVIDDYAAKLLQRKPLPLLPFSQAHLSPMEQEFYSNNRRVSNLKIKQELCVNLKYPTYKEGLTQIWSNDFAPSRQN